MRTQRLEAKIATTASAAVKDKQSKLNKYTSAFIKEEKKLNELLGDKSAVAQPCEVCHSAVWALHQEMFAASLGCAPKEQSAGDKGKSEPKPAAKIKSTPPVPQFSEGGDAATTAKK